MYVKIGDAISAVEKESSGHRNVAMSRAFTNLHMAQYSHFTLYASPLIIQTPHSAVNLITDCAHGRIAVRQGRNRMTKHLLAVWIPCRFIEHTQVFETATRVISCCIWNRSTILNFGFGWFGAWTARLGICFVQMAAEITPLQRRVFW